MESPLQINSQIKTINMHMLDKPIIKYMYFTLLKHAITSTVAFVIISEY